MTERVSPERAAELLDVLWPALDAALARDQGATSSDRVTAASIVPAAPVNTDVLSTMTAVGVEVVLFAQWCAEFLGEQHAERLPGDYFRHFPRWWCRLLELRHVNEAAAIEGTVYRWLRQVKLALGLAEPDRRLGQWCPRHDDQLAELVAPGADADVTWTRSVGGRPLDPRVTWHRPVGVLCRGCGATWQPGEYLALDRELRVADGRRLAESEAS